MHMRSVEAIVEKCRQFIAEEAHGGEFDHEILEDAIVYLADQRDAANRMFTDAVSALAEIDQILGLGSDGCGDPQQTVSAVRDLVAGLRR